MIVRGGVPSPPSPATRTRVAVLQRWRAGRRVAISLMQEVFNRIPY